MVAEFVAAAGRGRETSLRRLLEEHMASTPRRTKREASRHGIKREAWTNGIVETWTTAQDLVAHEISSLWHPKDGCDVLVFPDPSDEHWESLLTQVPQDWFKRRTPIMEDLPYKPLEFLSGTFEGSERRWKTVDEEGFAIVSTCERLECLLLWEGVSIYPHHRDLACIFDPDGCVSSLPKTTADRFEQGKTVLA